MKFSILAVLTLTLVAVGSSHHSDEGEHLSQVLTDLSVMETELSAAEAINNFIDTILKAVLERVRTEVKHKEPYPVPDFPPHKIEDKNVQANLTLTNVKENYVSTYVLNRLENSLLQMTEAFDITFPKLQFFGNYVIDGTVLKKKTHGKGTFNVTMANLHTWGKAYAYLADGSVQLKRLDIDYTLEDVTATATGLKVQGLSQREVREFLSKELLQYFTDNESIVSASISSAVVTEVNTLLKGMSITDLIKWFKHFIHPHYESN